MCDCNFKEEMAKKFAELDKVIAENKDEKGALIPILHEAQDIFGYLPYEVQEHIADGLDIPMSKVYGVATFYTQFTLQQKGKYRINVCLGTACYVKGAHENLSRFIDRLSINVGETTADGKFSLDTCRCVGACGLAPVVTVNDEVFRKVTPNMVDEIIAKFENM